jgi:hypothetical protein
MKINDEGLPFFSQLGLALLDIALLSVALLHSEYILTSGHMLPIWSRPARKPWRRHSKHCRPKKNSLYWWHFLKAGMRW